jgi:hypothetical protein
MAYVRIVTNKNGTVLRNIKMAGHSTSAVDQAAVALESIICEERGIVHIEVDYEDCDDSKTI